ncbi:MAG: prolyl oligopeptidase family serine peptidase [Candidatus Latescibacteria bacterium]|nr:prolyl oligopeptidase family serine peptidase [Candidatus Latescibacterota bacterium]
MSAALNQARAGEIPLLWAEPAAGAPRRLVVWLPGFSGNKEGVQAQLLDLAAAGLVGLSFDPWGHGERSTEGVEALRQRVRGNIRRHFWPILAHTAQETLQVIDWALSQLGVEPAVGMGGISMGGDISVAAAGLDHRIDRVAAAIATPDWLRPGSFEPPGEPDDDARTAYERCNPLTHLGAYHHCPALCFLCGDQDQQVPPDGAERFAAALAPAYAACPERLQVHRQPGTAHQFTPMMWELAIDWFARHR